MRAGRLSKSAKRVIVRYAGGEGAWAVQGARRGPAAQVEVAAPAPATRRRTAAPPAYGAPCRSRRSTPPAAGPPAPTCGKARGGRGGHGEAQGRGPRRDGENVLGQGPPAGRTSPPAWACGGAEGAGRAGGPPKFARRAVVRQAEAEGEGGACGGKSGGGLLESLVRAAVRQAVEVGRGGRGVVRAPAAAATLRVPPAARRSGGTAATPRPRRCAGAAGRRSGQGGALEAQGVQVQDSGTPPPPDAPIARPARRVMVRVRACPAQGMAMEREWRERAQTGTQAMRRARSHPLQLRAAAVGKEDDNAAAGRRGAGVRAGRWRGLNGAGGRTGCAWAGKAGGRVCRGAGADAGPQEEEALERAAHARDASAGADGVGGTE